MTKMGAGGGGGGGGASGHLLLSADELRLQIEEKTKILLDPTRSPQELANTNIELEKVKTNTRLTKSALVSRQFRIESLQ